MANPSQSRVEKLREKVNELREKVEELREESGEDDVEEVFIPAGGRTNYEDRVGSTAATGEDNSETETEEVEIPAAGRTNDAGTTVEREVPADSGMEAVQDYEAYIRQAQAEDERRRTERRKEARERRVNNGAYTLDDTGEIDASDVPVGGRSNWENRQEGEDR